MREQLSIFDLPTTPKPTGSELRDIGVKRAVSHAEEVEEGWQNKALEFLQRYLRIREHHFQFAMEDIRVAAYRFGKVSEAPSARAWGSVARESAKRGWIRKVGYVTVRNPNAHACFASLWESCL